MVAAQARKLFNVSVLVQDQSSALKEINNGARPCLPTALAVGKTLMFSLYVPGSVLVPSDRERNHRTSKILFFLPREDQNASPGFKDANLFIRYILDALQQVDIDHGRTRLLREQRSALRIQLLTCVGRWMFRREGLLKCLRQRRRLGATYLVQQHFETKTAMNRT